MAYKLSDNITSPLGFTTAENYREVKAGHSALQRYEGLWGLPEPFTASLFSDSQWQALRQDGLTRFEALAVSSAAKAIADAAIAVGGERVVFVLSTTKGNIELLEDGQHPETTYPGVAAGRIARRLGFTTAPIVVCNACISGLSAIVLANRLIESGAYDYAVVCGADVQCRFTVSGFQSLKAVAEGDCRPFDIERTGLNLGEAAATMVLARTPNPDNPNPWRIEAGAVRNDAFHISSPSKNGEGAFQALSAIGVQGQASRLAFVNAHGTATMFNDQMESVAIERAGLQQVPVNSLKGYFGHTLGAAGVLETILSMAAADDHTVLATRGFGMRGVSGKIRLSPDNSTTDKQAFVKMISGFGGGNAAILAANGSASDQPVAGHASRLDPRAPSHRVTITPEGAVADGDALLADVKGKELLSFLYRQQVADYPKYFKMDGLSRLGFLAVELLLKGCPAPAAGEGRGVVLFNRSSSVAADVKFQQSITGEDNFFPSPSVFVYTLPNIVTGEIAMRHQYHGETALYILPERDDRLMDTIIEATLLDRGLDSLISGWIDYEDDEHFVADLFLLTPDDRK